MNNNKKRWSYLSCLLGVVIASWQFSAIADDSEIYSSAAPSANPNILFLLDTSGSMDTADVPGTGAGGGLKKRIDVVKEVFADVIAGAPPNLNIGLIRYGGENSDFPSGVSFPVKPINAEALPVIASSVAIDNLPDPVAGQTVRDFLPQIVNSWSAKGYTPIVDSMNEVARYYRGEPVSVFAAQSPDHVRAAHPSSYTGDITGHTCASYSAPSECNNSYGWCDQDIVAGSCVTKPTKECDKYATVSGLCCDGHPEGYNEAGDAYGWVCTGAYYECENTNWDVCEKEVYNDREYCQQRTCNGKATTTNYVSPITSECQSNYVVLMSDGKPEGYWGPTQYPHTKDEIESKLGACADAPSSFQAGTCGPELAEYLANQDQNTTITGKQTIETFTIAFALNDVNGTKYLKSLAEAGHLKVANNADQLRNALKQVIAQATSVNKKVAAEPMYAAALPSLGNANLVAQAATNQTHPLVSTWALWKSFLNNPDLAKAMMKLFEPSVFTGSAPSLAATNNNFFHANNVKDLTAAFTSIIGRVQASASSFASPAYKVDPNSYLAHSDEVFIPVFMRTPNAEWKGNLKKFKLKNGVIVGKDDLPAVDTKGQFLDSAWDLWGAAPSGSEVAAGGAANLLDPVARVLWTNSSTDLITLDNTISKDLLGDTAMADAQRDALIQFTRGYDTDGVARHHLGDIMNSKPVMARDSTGKSYVLAGSNEGYLHAFDTETGLEKWAFMPSTLLKNISSLYANALTKDHLYGVDGALTVWYDDKNNDGQIKTADDDKVYVYFGLRRGGNAYYALDITDMNAPKLAWHVDNTMSDFSNLGESWAKPALAKMRVADTSASSGSALKDVLVFGGGFDPILEDQDPSHRVTHTKGYDVYIVDAHTGSLIWSLRRDVSTAVMELKYSIPGDIRVLDMDRNGALDRLYFGDTGGNLWRVDMDVDVGDADN
ncbi:MAG TPA: PilC/PilY family type IV pilus protein, partial [Thiolinea sp.]|nr:PilC/PilY family type IV pilus protein [Thiolinea sp.]